MDSFIIGQQLVNGITLGAIYGLIAVGYTMVYGIIGMINFAHGDIYMVSAYLGAIFLAVITFFGIDSVVLALIITLLFTIVFTALYGWSVERIAYRPLRGSTRLAPLISAIGMSLILQNYVQLSQGARNQGFPALVEGSVRVGDGAQFFQVTYLQMIIVVTAFVSMGILTYVIHKTSLGRACRATQQDPMMAEVLGINTDRIISIVFVLGAIMAAVAGILVSLNYGSFDFYKIGRAHV